MGNRSSTGIKNKQNYKQILNESDIIKHLETECVDLRSLIKELIEKNNKLEIRLYKMEQLYKMHDQKHLDIVNTLSNHNNKINVITNDMESLLNNDKLLLDKLIEKNIVSTIEEEEEADENEL
jgi:hypothetical protein